MSASAVKFPALCFHRKYALVVNDWDSLTTTTSYGLKHGEFDGLLIVDSTGRAFAVSGAKKLHGVGPLGGYNIFLNQRIKVEPQFTGEPFQMTLEELKQRLFQSFEEWHGWSSSGNFEELREGIKRADSLKAIFDLLTSA